MDNIVRIVVMLAVLAAGHIWLRPSQRVRLEWGLHFVDEARSAGCLNHHSMPQLSPRFANIMPWLASVGAAAAAGDYDGDGDADLYVTNSGAEDSNRLLRNRGDGTFEDVTHTAGVACTNTAGASMHALWGDVDNDGRLDLYVAKWAAPNSLFLNRGDGAFVEVAAGAGVDYWGYGNAATFVDFDRDGWLDILIGNYFAEQVVDPATGQWAQNDLWNPVTTRVMHDTFTHARNGGRKVLYRNRGDGTFVDVADAAGLRHGGWALAGGAGDLNNDGWPDLYIANDFGPDELYLNTGATEDPPRFRLVIDPAGHPGVGNDWWKGMNVDMADVNNDGYLDVYVTNIMERNYKTDEGNMLWLNEANPLVPGGRGFRNVALAAGVQDGGWGWGAKFADFNNDGLLDVFTVNGFATGDPHRTYWYHIQEMVTQTKNQTADAADWPVMDTRDLSGRELSRLYIQNPEQPATFVDAAEGAGLADRYNGRGIALADYNLDGALDIYIANQGGPSCYYVNRPGLNDSKARRPAGFIRIQLVGRPDIPVSAAGRNLVSTTDAVGARVTVDTTAGRMMREVQGGMGFASQSEHALHFGIPDPDAIREITITWPSGRTQKFGGQSARGLVNHHVRVLEAGEPVVLR